MAIKSYLRVMCLLGNGPWHKCCYPKQQQIFELHTYVDILDSYVVI